MYKKLSIKIESKYEYVTVWGKVRSDWLDTESYKEKDWMGVGTHKTVKRIDVLSVRKLMYRNSGILIHFDKATFRYNIYLIFLQW